MRTLLRLIQRYSNFLLFLLLETVAVLFMVQSNSFQGTRIVHWNRQISGFIYSRAEGAREYLSLKETNQTLAEQNRQLRNRIDRLTSMLDSTTAFSDSEGSYRYSYMGARVVRNSVHKQYNYITIDRGRKQGVFRDMGVISETGLVGIVLEASNNFATVIPVINRDFRLSVKLKSNNYAGILQWTGENPRIAVLNEIPFHVDLDPSDTVVTSGFSAIFPEGIPVGTIGSFSLDPGNFYEINVLLSTDFQQLYRVNVIRNFRRQEQMELQGPER